MAREGPADSARLRVALLAVGNDADAAIDIGQFLRGAGIAVVDTGSGEALDGLLVLLSPAAVEDRRWREAAATVPAARLVPVRTVQHVDASKVPERLAEINFIDWRPESADQAHGFILAGLHVDHEQHRLGRRLGQQAEAWARAGRDAALLIDDRREAQRMAELLGQEGRYDVVASTTDTTKAYVSASLASTKRSSRKRLWWRGTAVLALLVAIAVAASALPDIRASERINKAAVSTAGDPSTIDLLPEFSAANSAALLIEGTPTQQALGRETLTRTLALPWEVAQMDHVDSVRDMVHDGEGRGLVVAYVPGGSALASVDLDDGSIIDELPLGARFERLDLSPDGTQVVVAGEALAVVDRATGTRRALKTDRGWADVRWTGPAQVTAWGGDGALQTFNVGDGRMRAAQQHEAVLDVRTAGDGQTRALIVRRDKRVAIVDATAAGAGAGGGAMVPGTPTVGVLAPDGQTALVPGNDGQLWSVARQGLARPTALSLPDELNDLAWADGDRLVLASSDRRGEVVLLPGGAPLGRLCWGQPGVARVRLDRRSDLVGCVGDSKAFHRLPPGPLRRPPAGRSSAKDAATTDFAVFTKGSRVRFRRLGGRFGSGLSGTSLNSLITAVTVAPSGDQVAVAAVNGGVVVFGATPEGFRTLSVWDDPSGEPVEALSWERQLVATTASGRSWPIPTCPGCQTDEGLLDEAGRRFTGCMTKRQLSFIGEKVRKRLGLKVCPPVRVLRGG